MTLWGSVVARGMLEGSVHSHRSRLGPGSGQQGGSAAGGQGAPEQRLSLDQSQEGPEAVEGVLGTSLLGQQAAPELEAFLSGKVQSAPRPVSQGAPKTPTSVTSQMQPPHSYFCTHVALALGPSWPTWPGRQSSVARWLGPVGHGLCGLHLDRPRPSRTAGLKQEPVNSRTRHYGPNATGHHSQSPVLGFRGFVEVSDRDFLQPGSAPVGAPSPTPPLPPATIASLYHRHHQPIPPRHSTAITSISILSLLYRQVHYSRYLHITITIILSHEHL